MRYLIVRKSLGERIAARRPPPPQAAPQQTVPDRQEWQRNYLKQSQSGTDIHSATGDVGDSGIKQEQMNAMSPADRLAHLQKIARQQPVIPHYHVLPGGQVAWGHGGAGTRPVRPGEKLLAHREPLRPPTPVRVDSHLQTHMGRGMRVIHPDGNHEDMHGPPLHPMTVATQRQVPPRPVMLKSAEATKRHRKPPRRHHQPRHGMEGRDQHGSDVWYHAGWLLAHDPQVARGCGLHQEERQIEDGGGDDAAGAGEAMASSLPPGTPLTGTGKRRIAAPGSRGGRFYYDDHGDVVYGDRPAAHYREAQAGDHLLTGQGHGRVVDHDEGRMGVRYTGGGAGTVGPGDIARMAPGHLHGGELPPDMADAHDAQGGEPDAPADPGALRRRMARQPLPGDRLDLAHGGARAEVQGRSGDDVLLRDQAGGSQVMAPHDWERTVRDVGVPREPDYRHPARGRALREAEARQADPREIAAAAMRDAMEPGNEAPPDPTDTSGDYPQRATMRATMRAHPWPGDVITVVGPLWLDGNSYEPGTGYTVAYVEGGEPELYDHWGNPSASLDAGEWQRLLDQNAVVPMKRGDPPPDEPDVQIPGEGVFGVFAGKVSKQEVAAAWTGTHSSGYSTTVDTLAEGIGKVALTGSILDPQGAHVGSFERLITRDGRGQVTVDHSYLQVNQEMKVGFAQEFNAQAEERYRDWGVHRITLYADISVGKYCWARQGYDWSDPDDGAKLRHQFYNFCKSQGHHVDEDTLSALAHPWDIAGYDSGDEVTIQGHPATTGGTDWVVDGSFPLGKAFFLADPQRTRYASDHWHGVKVLDKDD